MLKKIKILLIFNNFFKSFSLIFKYKIIKFYYFFKEIKFSSNLTYLPRTDKKLSILFLGTDYQQDNSGMLQALHKLGDVTFFTKSNNSDYGLYPSIRLGEKTPYIKNTNRLLAIINQMAIDGKPPNLIIGQFWGGVFDAKILNYARTTYGTISVCIAMDDRHSFWCSPILLAAKYGTYGVIRYVDCVATAAPEAVNWYAKEGCKSIFFPEASDPVLFSPKSGVPKTFDVVFVGAKYGIREALIFELMNAGIKVTTFGSGWPNGVLPINRVADIFAQAKIILGVGAIGHCNNFCSLKLRDFDAPMSGSFYLTQHNSDLEELYQIGTEIVTYHSIDDCIDKIKYFLANDERREEIAMRGRIRAVRDHTWDNRFSYLINFLSKS